MEEKIYDEWNKPDWVQVDGIHLEKLEENNNKYENAVESIKETLSSHSMNEIEKLEEIEKELEELENELY